MHIPRLIVLLAASFGAETPPAAPIGLPTFWGIVVGIDEYQNKKIPTRSFARADAEMIYDHLTAGSGMAASASRVWLLTDRPDASRGAVLATADNVRRTFRTIASRAKRDDVLIIYWKGNGVPSGNEFRWFCADADPEQFAATTILSAEFEELAQAIDVRQGLALVDACFESTAQAMGMQTAIADANWPKAFRGFSGSGRYVFSSNAGKVACPVDHQKSRGLFALTLIDGLSGRADTEGGEPDAWVTAAELWRYLQAALPASAVELGHPRASAEPVLVGGKRPPYLRLARNPAAAPKVNGLLSKLAEVHQHGDIDDNAYAEGARVLQSMPRFDRERKLRRAYSEYLDGAIDKKRLEEIRADAVRDWRLPPDEARKFASVVLEVEHRIEEIYVKEKRGRQAIVSGILGLMREAEEPIPNELREALSNIDSATEQEIETLLIKVRELLGQREDMPGKRPMEIMLSEMLQSLDPYSQYYSEETWRDRNAKNTAGFAGIGVLLGEDPKSHSLVVVTPVLDGPAFSRGVRAGDRIIKIDDNDVRGVGLDRASEMLTGPKGKEIKIVVERAGTRGPMPFTITRDSVHVETVVGNIRRPDYSWDFWLDPARHIAYVRLTEFAEDTADRLQETLSKLRRDGMAALILDLRGNGGGILTAAEKVADLFLDDGVIVTIRDRHGKATAYNAARLFTHRMPLAVLINGDSASGSEIVAAAIADHKRGVIIGERSFGKGSVQSIYELDGKTNGAMKLTTDTFHRPSGDNLHRFPGMTEADTWGVKPDEGFEIKLHREEVGRLKQRFRDHETIRDAAAPILDDSFKDLQLERALDYLRERVRPSAN